MESATESLEAERDHWRDRFQTMAAALALTMAHLGKPREDGGWILEIPVPEVRPPELPSDDCALVVRAHPDRHALVVEYGPNVELPA